MIESRDVVRRLLALALVVAAALSGVVSLPLMLLLAGCIAAMDTSSLVNIRNVVVIYFTLIFGFGGSVLPGLDAERLQAFGAGWIWCFAAGAVLGGALWGFADNTRLAGARLPAPSRRAALLIVAAAMALQLLLLAVDVARLGVSEYLSGALLADRLTAYAAGGLGMAEILKLVVGTIAVAAAAVFVAAGYPSRRLHWLVLASLLVILPLVRLERMQVVVGLLALLLLYSTVSSVPAEASVKRNAARRGVTRVAVVMVAVTVMAGVGLVIGGLRSAAVSSGEPQPATALLQGEFDPARLVDATLEPEFETYGAIALVEPAMLRFVPRRVLVSKPLNPTGRFMTENDPGSFAAGYSLAPTGVGTLLLVFGTASAYLAAILVGTVTAGFRGPARSPMGRGVQMVAFLSLYGLLRNDLANSVPVLVLVLVLYLVFYVSAQPAPKRAATSTARA